MRRTLIRIAVLAVTAVAIAGLTKIYGDSGSSPRPNAIYRAAHQNRKPGPNTGELTEFAGECLLFFFWTGVGRIALKLRLTPPPRNEGRLGLIQPGFINPDLVMIHQEPDHDYKSRYTKRPGD